MKISHMRTNHLVNPLGYRLDPISFSWTVDQSTGKRQAAARIEVSLSPGFQSLEFDSGRQESISSLAYSLPLKCRPCTRYYWRVTVWADDGDMGTSAPAWFETARQDQPWAAKWVASPLGKEVHPLFFTRITLPCGVKRARAYACGLGLYELEVNGQKAGNEYLTPFYNDYASWLQYQTYDVTDLLQPGENRIQIMLGNGWYKGRFGWVEDMSELYGDQFLLLCQLEVELENGSRMTLGTGEDWLCCPSPVRESSIYNGEYYDGTIPAPEDCPQAAPAVAVQAPEAPLSPRLSPPVRVIQKLPAPILLHTPAGEQVLDFGQEITGWVEFHCDLPRGSEITLEHGEILQQGNFYAENLRTAKQRMTYRSGGQAALVRPHFTFFGFRYVRVTGLAQINPGNFTACVVHSDLEITGSVHTSNPKVNRLALNALWGQRGNFLDVPTDCPQRDERMGWTGDAQVFAPTACFFMETPAFYDKYLLDMRYEQAKNAGSVPHVIPDALGQIARKQGSGGESGGGHGSCAWADAATVIPWTLYRFYGDKELLRRHYPVMKAWVDYIKQQDDTNCASSRLWTCGFHFADWLALDNPDKESPFGGTDSYFIASAYYYYSASLTAKAAAVLGNEDDASFYLKLAGQVKEAIGQEYFTSTGRLACATQTGLVVALYFDLVPPQFRQRLAGDLAKQLENRNLHLNTGFVGTPYLCPSLSENGLGHYAYRLLLNEDYPSWLYEVNMGATTIWERWNSVLPDGLISGTGMNSLNHYAYGSVMEWVFRYMCGLTPCEQAPGFKTALIAPCPDRSFAHAQITYRSAAGHYVSGWQWEDGGIQFNLRVPFDAQATFRPQVTIASATVNGLPSPELEQTGSLTLSYGSYCIVVKTQAG